MRETPLEDCPVRCPDCAGTDFDVDYADVVADFGRTTIVGVFVGCNECSATIWNGTLDEILPMVRSGLLAELAERRRLEDVTVIT